MAAPTPSPMNPQPFTVASFNARWGYDLTNEEFDLGEVCARLDADLIALQEVWEPADRIGQARAAADRLGYSWTSAPLAGSNVRAEPRITRHAHETDGWWGVALLSRRTVLSNAVVDLGRPRGRVDVAHRRAIRADIDVAGTAVRVFVVHLSFVPPLALWQLARLRRLAAQGEQPTLVVGDCNLPATIVRPAFAGWHPAVGARTWPARSPVAQLDHLLVRGVGVERGQALPAVGSDHLPIRAHLTVPPPRSGPRS